MDNTYILMKSGFVYLTVILDWFNRYVESWAVSITADVDFCIKALHKTLKVSQPEIFNSDQGSRFTS